MIPPTNVPWPPQSVSAGFPVPMFRPGSTAPASAGAFALTPESSTATVWPAPSVSRHTDDCLKLNLRPGQQRAHCARVADALALGHLGLSVLGLDLFLDVAARGRLGLDSARPGRHGLRGRCGQEDTCHRAAEDRAGGQTAATLARKLKIISRPLTAIRVPGRLAARWRLPASACAGRLRSGWPAPQLVLAWRVTSSSSTLRAYLPLPNDFPRGTWSKCARTMSSVSGGHSYPPVPACWQKMVTSSSEV